MADQTNKNHPIIDTLYKVSEQLKEKHTIDLIQKQNIAYGEAAMSEEGIVAGNKLKFPATDLASLESIASSTTTSKRANLQINMYKQAIDSFNDLMDLATKELAESINTYGETHKKEIDAARQSEELKARIISKYAKESKIDDSKKTLEQHVADMFAINTKLKFEDSVDHPYVDMESYRSAILEKLGPDAYETWDLNEKYIRENLIEGKPGNFTSTFLSDETVKKLNDAHTIDSEQAKAYSEYRDKKTLEAAAERKRLLEIWKYGHEGNPQSPKYNAKYRKEFEKEFKDFIDIKTTDLNKAKTDKINLEVQSREVRNKMEIVTKESVRIRSLADKKMALLEAVKESASEQNAIDFEYHTKIINETIGKAKEEIFRLTKETQHIRSQMSKVNDTLQVSKNFFEKTEAEQMELFKTHYKEKLNRLVKTIDNKGADEEALAKHLSNNLERVWGNKENITFKSFTPEEFKHTIESLEDPREAAILKQIYSLDKKTNTYKKDKFFLWTVDDSTGLKGISEIVETPSEASKYFSLSEHGKEIMDDYYVGSVAQNRVNAELVQIKKALTNIKNEYSSKTFNERIMALQDLNSQYGNTEDVQKQIETEESKTIGSQEAESKPNTNKFEWVSDDERKLLGDESFEKLHAATRGQDIIDFAKAKKKIEKDETKKLVDVNREYINILDKASNNEVLQFNKSEIKRALDSFDTLTKIQGLIDANTSSSLISAKEALLSYSQNGYFVGANEINNSMKKRGLYGNILDVNDVAHLNGIVEDSLYTVTNHIDTTNYNLMNAIDEHTIYAKKPDVVETLQSNRSENRIQKIMEDSDTGIMDGKNGSRKTKQIVEQRGWGKVNGRRVITDIEIPKEIRTFSGLEQEEVDSLFAETHKLSNELDKNDRAFLVRSVAIEENADREVSKIQKRQVEFVSEYVKRSHNVVKLKNINRPLTMDELKNGVVKGLLNNEKRPTPIAHLSEYYDLMSITRLDKERDRTKPFTKEEWEKKVIKISDNHILPIEQFFEYYNTNVRKAQNDDIRAEIEAHNNSVHNNIANRRAEMDKEIDNLYNELDKSKQAEIASVNKDVETFLLNHDKTKGKISNGLVRIGSENRLKLLSPDINNLEAIMTHYGIQEREVPSRLMRNVNSLKGYSKEKEILKAKELSAKHIEKEELPKLKNIESIKDDLTHNDVMEYYKYKQNSYLSKTAPADKPRVVYLPKQNNPDVVDILYDVKRNSNSKGLHFKGDTLVYDVVNINKDKYTVKPQNWIKANDITMKIDFGGMNPFEALELANKHMDEIDGYNIVDKSSYQQASEKLSGKVNIDGSVYTRGELFTKLQRSYMPVEISEGHNNVVKNTPIHKAAYDVIKTNFDWMLNDRALAGSVADDATISVIEAMAEVSEGELNKKYALHREAIAEGTKNLVDVVEDSISNRLKGKLLQNYIGMSGGDTGTALIRAARISLEGKNVQVNVENVSEFLRTVASSVRSDNELGKYYNDIHKVLNDRGYLENMIQSDITSVTPHDPLLTARTVSQKEYDINDDDHRRHLYGEYTAEEYLFPEEIDSERYKLSEVNPVTLADPDYVDAKQVAKQINNKRVDIARETMNITYGTDALGFMNTSMHKYAEQKATEEFDRLVKAKKVEPTNRKLQISLLSNRKYAEIRSSKLPTEELLKELDTVSPQVMALIKRKAEKGGDKKALKLYEDFIEGKNVKVSTVVGNLQSAKKNLQTEDLAVKLRAIREHVEENGFNSFIQYVQSKGTKENPMGGLPHLFTPDQFKKLSQEAYIRTTEDYKNLAMLTDLIPGINITASAQDANGNTVRFNIKDAKSDYNGHPGLTVRNIENGQWLPIVNTDQKGNAVGLEEVRTIAATNRSDIDTQAKTQIDKIEKTPIFVNAGKTKTTIMPDAKFDFDKAANTGGGVGSMSPITSLTNMSNLLQEVDKNGSATAMTFDYETTGLPDKLAAEGKSELFQPVEVAIQKYNVTKGEDGKYNFELMPDKSETFKLAPTEAVENHLQTLYGEDAVSKLASDLNSNDVHLLKNYAKYSMDNAAYRTRIDTDAEGIKRVSFLQNIADESGKNSQQWVTSTYTPESYVKDLQMHTQNAIYNMKEEGATPRLSTFMNKVIDANYENGKQVYTIAHNMSGAEKPWSNIWINNLKKDIGEQRAKNQTLLASTEGALKIHEYYPTKLKGGALYDFLEPEEQAKYEATKQELQDKVKFYSKEIKGANTVLEKLDRPILDKGIDTIQIAKILEPGQEKFSLIDLANYHNINTEGLAHLADVDVPKTTKLAEVYANHPEMMKHRDTVANSLGMQDIIVKHAKSKDGLQLDRGVYRIDDIEEAKEGGVKLHMTDLTTKKKIEPLHLNNMATLQRDAMDNWTRFAPDQEANALKLHSELEAVEANRTLKNAMVSPDTWLLHKRIANDGGNEKILQNFVDLKDQYHLSVQKAQDNLTPKTVQVGNGEVPKMTFTPLSDLDKFVLAKENVPRFEGEGYVKELIRFSEPISNRRLSANKLELGYMDSDEGQLVEKHLIHAQNRFDAGVIDQKQFSEHLDNIRNSVHDLKLEAFKTGELDATHMLEVPDNFNLGEINTEVLSDKKLGGIVHGFGEEKMASIKPFDFTLNFNNHQELSTSLWKAASNIADNMLFNNKVKSREEGRKIAMNRYIMPLLQDKGILPRGGEWNAISDLASNMAEKIPANRVPIPKAMTNIVPVAVNYMMDNKKAITRTLDPLLEVNMLKATTKGSKTFTAIEAQLEKSLKNLDYNAASFDIGPDSFHSPELQKVQQQLVHVAQLGREDATKAVGGHMPFFKYNIDSERAMKYVNTELPQVSEFNIRNAVSPKLGMMTAADIKKNADELLTDRELITPTNFRQQVIYGDRNRVMNAMPEYVDIFRQRGGTPDTISKLNKNITDEMEERAYKPLQFAIRGARNLKADMYKELARRASANSQYSLNNLDPRQLSLDNIDRTKFNAMLQLGWAQKGSDGKIISGAIARPGEAQQTEENYAKSVAANKDALEKNAKLREMTMLQNAQKQRPLIEFNKNVIAENKALNAQSQERIRSINQKSIQVFNQAIEDGKVPLKKSEFPLSMTEGEIPQLHITDDNGIPLYVKKDDGLYKVMQRLNLQDIHANDVPLYQGTRNIHEFDIPVNSNNIEVPSVPDRKLDPSKIVITSRAGIDNYGQGYYTGKHYTDLNLTQLKALSESQYTNPQEKIMMQQYLNIPEIERHHTDAMASMNMQKTLESQRKVQYQASGLPKGLTETQDWISSLNQNILENGATKGRTTDLPPIPKTKASIDAIPESPFTEASKEFRSTVKEISGEAKAVLGELMNRDVMKFAGLGLAFAGAMALTKQYTSDGGSPDAKPQSNKAPTVDGQYAPEYNGSKHPTIPTQKTVRVEENGKGMTVNVSAKNKGNIDDKQLQQSVSDAVNSTVQADIRIHQTDDRQTIDHGYVSNLFSQLLGGKN